MPLISKGTTPSACQLPFKAKGKRQNCKAQVVIEQCSEHQNAHCKIHAWVQLVRTVERLQNPYSAHQL